MSLSEHRFEDYDYWSYKEKDVKEFIRLLKAGLNTEAWDRKLTIDDSSLDRLPLRLINDTIDKLAGDELI